MRDPESRRGVPLRAGVGIATVAATVVAGIALANPASAAVTLNSVALTPKGASAIVGQAKTFTITALNNDGSKVANGETFTVTLTQSTPSPGATVPSPKLTLGDAAGLGSGPVSVSSTPTNGATSSTISDTIKTGDNTVSGSGTATFTVASDTAGAVSVTVADVATPAVKDSTTLTEVASVGSANANVKTLSASATSNTGYVADANPAKFTVTATNASGVPVIGATISYSVTTGTTTTGPTDFGTLTDSNGQVVIPLTAAQLNAAAGGSGTVNFWVNNATSGGTPTADPGEPTASAAFTLTANPTATTTTITTAHENGGNLPSGAQNVMVTFNVKNVAAPVVGAHVAVDALVPATAATATRYSATTDSSGNATVSIPVTAAQAADGGTIKVTAYFSQSSTPNDGLLLPVTNSATYTFANPVPTTVTDGGITAVDNQPGGTVSIPVTVTDQFGNPAGVGTNVFYNVTSTNGNAATGKTAVIGSDGVANVTYTDVSGQTDATKLTNETLTITSAAGLSAGLPGPITVTYVASTAPGKVTVLTPPTGTTASQAAGTVNNGTLVGTTTVSASKTANYKVVFQVFKADGTTVASGGVPVTVSVNQGFVGTSVTTDSTAGKSVSARTDNNGQVTVYVGSTTPGAQTVTATAGSQTVSTNAINYAALAPATVTLTGPTSIATGSTGKFTAKVVDSLGNGVAGQSLTFTATDSSVLPGSVSPLIVTTGADGTVTVTITAGSADGTITVLDTSANAPASPNNAASASYTVKAAGPATMRVIVGHGRALQLEMIDALPLDSMGNRLGAGISIRFQVSGAATLTATATTNRYGYAQIRFIPPRSGYLTATATTGSVSGTGSAYIKAPIERPTLSAASRVAGIIHVVVYSHPRQPYSSFILYKSAGHRYISAGTFKANKYGATRVNLTVRKGATLYLRALGTNTHYVEYYSNVVRIKAAG